jgi:membrane protease YdiL (CAAX protease family)
MFFALPPDAPIQALFGLAGTFSPVLVALTISALAKPGAEKGSRSRRLTAFTCTWLFSWLVLVMHEWHIRGAALEASMIVPVGIVAMLPGWFLSCAFSRRTGVRELFRTLLLPRGHFVWYLAVLAVVPVVQLTGAGITVLLGGEIESELTGMTFSDAAGVMGLVFLRGFLVTGGVNEETGWRGFVLPRLQARFPVIGAVAVVWFFWALWHIPYDIGTGTPLESILLNRIYFNFIWSVLFAFAYNRTGGSLLAPAMFHPAMNTFGHFFPCTDTATVIFGMLALFVVWYGKMWKRLPSSNPATYRTDSNA